MHDRHGWNGWDQYQAIHLRYIENYRNHFILDDQLEAIPTVSQVRWQGTLYCVDGLEIQVRKLQEVRLHGGRPQVRTTRYSYHVLQRVGSQTVNWLRYDNVHTSPGHPTSHHRHRYDADGDDVEPAEHRGVQGWPTLGEVIGEVQGLWAARQGSEQH